MNDNLPKRKTFRCAIYTRKSHEEGLEQDFNTLDAQREAAQAYIQSQQHEGWRIIRTQYDDGGFTGANTNRPALNHLIQDIKQSHIDIVVVYKVDRLSRSLADFSNLIQLFDDSNVSFVSVTQQFNTSTSMGRLTLNVLLSFAQFEREVTAERIRDKIAASKSKGLWMGGLPPLGYDPHPDKTKRELVINNNEAITLRRFFTLYNQLGCLRKVEEAASSENLRSKFRQFASGRTQGGIPLSRGAIHKLLTNPIYIGKIKHKQKQYDGQHKAIIDEALWSQIQEKLKQASRKQRGISHLQSSGKHSPLKGKLFDETGDILTPTHTTKSERVYHYYIAHRLTRAKDSTAYRLPAAQIEKTLNQLITKHIEEVAHNLILFTENDIQTINTLKTTTRYWLDSKDRQTPDILSLLKQAIILQKTIQISLDIKALVKQLSCNKVQINPKALKFTIPMSIQKRGVEAKIITDKTFYIADPTLQRALAKAHHWMDAIKSGHSISQIAKDESITDGFIRARFPLATLSPKIQKSIMQGTQPIDLTLEKIVRMKLPLDWQKQEVCLGFD